MISRVTIFSLLLGLMGAVALVQWQLGHRDECTAYLNGNRKAQSTVLIPAGERSVEIPCEVWLPRQPDWVKLLCLVELVLAVLFVLNATLDGQRALRVWWARWTR